MIQIAPQVINSSHSSRSTSYSFNRVFIIMAYLLICGGIALRVFHFFDNRSQWMDEMYLSINLVKMSFMELATAPLDFQQKAPIGYLWFSKLSVMIFGTDDKAMRFFPFICGVFSLLAFYPVTKHFLKPLGVAIALGILAFSPILAYHAVEAKQYSTEVLCTILALYLYVRYREKTDIQSLLLWSFWGAAILWFSFSAIFILAGMAAGCSLVSIHKKDWKRFFIYLIPFGIWMMSFAINYLFFTQKHGESDWLVAWFQNREGFMPTSFSSKIEWIAKKSFTILNFPLGLSWFSLPSKYHDNAMLLILVRFAFVHLFILGVGIVCTLRKRAETCFVLGFPILLHLLATVLVIYPFYERLTVYLGPLLILFIAFGAERIVGYFNTPQSIQIQNSPIIRQVREEVTGKIEERKALSGRKWSWVMLFILLFGPMIHSAKGIINTNYFGFHKHWHQKELLTYLNQNYKDGDGVYIYWNGTIGYQYYNLIHDYRFETVEAKDHRFVSKNFNDYLSHIKSDMQSLRKKHKRLWVIYGKHLFVNIGEYDNDPYWYYNTKNHVSLKHEAFNTFGILQDSYEVKEKINLYLFEQDSIGLK